MHRNGRCVCIREIPPKEKPNPVTCRNIVKNAWHMSAWLLTTISILQQKLPSPQPTIDCGILLAIDVQVIVTLPEVPPLLHFSDGAPLPVLHIYGGVDEVEGSPHSEDDLTSCMQGRCKRMGKGE